MSTTYAGANNFPTAVTLPSDGDGPIKAADVNVPLQGLADRTVFVGTLVKAMHALNWSPRVVSWRTLLSGSAHLGCEGIVYSDKMRGWWAVVNDASNNRVFMASAVDPLGVWTGTASVSTTNAVVWMSPPVTLAASALVIAAVGVAAVQIKFVASSGGAPSLSAPASLAGAGSVSSGLTSCFFNGQALFLTSLGADLGTILSTPDGTTFAKVSFATNAGRAPWIVAASGTVCVAVATYFGGATDIRMQTSTNGTSWAASSIASPHSGSGEIPKGICWSAGASLFFLLTENNAGNGVHYVYSSPDGTTWTYVSTFTISELGTNFHVLSVAAIGTVLVAAVNDGALATTRIVFSADAGVTWNYRCDVVEEPNDSLTNSGAMLGQVVASGDRFLLATEIGLRLSLRANLGGALTL